MEINRKISDKEKQFTNKMEEMKSALEEEAKRFYQELDDLRENSSKKFNDNFEKKVLDKKEVKPRKPRSNSFSGATTQ